METTFAKILSDHRTRYPLMEAQDCAKLAFQSEFGPAHLVSDPEAAARDLRREWENLSPGMPMRDPEDIGNGLCRFHLNPGSDPELAAPLLARLFVLTAQEHTGTTEGLYRKLACCETPDTRAWFDAYRARGCPAVHHSAAFRDAYAPHYRLVLTEHAQYFPVLLRIAALCREKSNVLIAIDGRCGSGKTGLAALIARLFPCNVFHMDDYYLPLDRRAPDWETLPAGNMDLVRFRTEVLLPARSGSSVSSVTYDCQSGTTRAPVRVPPRPLTVIEGSYSHHPALDVGYDLKIFLTCPPDEQVRRLQAREGDYFPMFRSRWIPMEERYFARFQMPGPDSLILDTGGLFR